MKAASSHERKWPTPIPVSSRLDVRPPGVSWASSTASRRTMQANTRTNTSPELAVRTLLHHQGLRYRVDWPLPIDGRRRADIAFTKAKVVVFIDGCFWHSCPTHYVPPKRNAEYWLQKRIANRVRDRDTDRRMREIGWTVVRIWEHEVPEKAVAKIVDVLQQEAG